MMEYSIKISRKRSAFDSVFLIFLGILPLLFVGYYQLTNITTEGSFIPQCYLKKFTGLLCIFCGGQRAVDSILEGQWREALQFNAFLTVFLPFGMVLYYTLLYRLWKYPGSFIFRSFPGKLVMVLTMIGFVFMIGRNILERV